VNQAGYPLAIKHPGGCTGPTCVSSTPSKIPYGGFSPVRLQTGIQQRPSPQEVYTLPKPGPQDPMATFVACQRVPLARAIQSRGPWLPSGLCCPTGSLLTMASSEPLHSHLVTYLLRLPSISGAGGSPLSSTPLSNRAISRTPVDWTGAYGCFFPAHTSLRQLRNSSASTPSCLPSVHAGCVTRLTSSLSLRPDWLLARHRHRLLLSSFRAAGYPYSTSNITTRLQPTTAAGLSPARDAALWAANGDTEETNKDSLSFHITFILALCLGASVAICWLGGMRLTR